MSPFPHPHAKGKSGNVQSGIQVSHFTVTCSSLRPVCTTNTRRMLFHKARMSWLKAPWVRLFSLHTHTYKFLPGWLGSMSKVFESPPTLSLPLSLSHTHMQSWTGTEIWIGLGRVRVNNSFTRQLQTSRQRVPLCHKEVESTTRTHPVWHHTATSNKIHELGAARWVNKRSPGFRTHDSLLLIVFKLCVTADGPCFVTLMTRHSRHPVSTCLHFSTVNSGPTDGEKSLLFENAYV